MTLDELVALYDADQPVTVCRMFQDADKEHHGQCLAVEVCREFELIGLTLDGWNAMTDELQWAEMIISASKRARMNTSASHYDFTISDALTAASYAGNYFEHGYDLILENTAPDHVTFTRTGGIQAQ